MFLFLHEYILITFTEMRSVETQKVRGEKMEMSCCLLISFFWAGGVKYIEGSDVTGQSQS